MNKGDYNYLFPIRCYLDSEGHETDKKMRFVDMCIEIDSQIPHGNEKDSEGHGVVDKDRMFNLIYSLCLMLSSKAKMCSDGREYDDFAYYLAYDIFNKIENWKKDVPLKSVLNYAKSIINGRYKQFKRSSVQQIFDPYYNSRGGDGTLKNNIIESWQSTSRDKTVEEVKLSFNEFSKVILKNIPSKLKKNKYLCKNLYISSVLTLIKIFDSTDTRRSYLFDRKYEIVSFHLGNEYHEVIKLIINKSLLDLADEIKTTIDKFKIGDTEYEILMNSVFGSSDKNEEYYTLD